MPLIAIDAMGGDHAPGQVVLGAIDASKDGNSVVLVGDVAAIDPILDDVGYELGVVHASEFVAMAEDPAAAIRDKKDASISVAARLVASGEAAGLVSAGSTGAALAAAAFTIGRLAGISRPAIATVFPGNKLVLDAGANLTCKPDNLVQFGVMGSALAQSVLGIENPRVGLVNIGEEKGKGRDLEKAAFVGLSALPSINFIGNVEGRDVGGDVVDVLVTDGFTGNVLLKTAEGAAHLVSGVILEGFARPEYSEAVAELRPALEELEHRINPESTGGAHLLGTKGVVVIAHGSSSRVAVANAISLATEGASHGLVEKIARGLVSGDH